MLKTMNPIGKEKLKTVLLQSNVKLDFLCT